jgi:probable rRNA maturation factor
MEMLKVPAMKDRASQIRVELQLATGEPDIPGEDDFSKWAELALRATGNSNDLSTREITIRLVDEPESRELNSRYRDKNSPTNVLSFPADIPVELAGQLEAESGGRMLGDLVICAPLVNHEAAGQGKLSSHHWAHLVIHGILHLSGYNHIEPDEAQAMETLEKDLLATLGIADPYLVD